MNSIGKVIKSFKTELKDVYPDSEIKSITELVLEHCCGFSKTDFIINQDKLIDMEIARQLTTILTHLKNQEPIQYILGETEFYDLTFKVETGVLIPRQETEELVDWILKSNHAKTGLQILDIGTGSGCIAISLAANSKNTKVMAYDISDKAIVIANKNAKLNKLDIDIQKKDILQVTADIENIKFDIIVSNPPYVLEKEKVLMQKNVLEHEPDLALFVENTNPLQFYEAIANYASLNLKTRGQLYFEINEAFGEETCGLLKNKGFEQIELRKDLNGKDRMVKAIHQ